jgi:hypothetical protein
VPQVARLARRADFEALDADVQAGGMIIAGVHYRREEVDAARRLLRELGQPERALRSVLEFVRRERAVPEIAEPPLGSTHVPATAHRSSPVATHRRIEAKRQALDRLARRWAELRRAIDPSYSWPMAQSRVNRAMEVARRSDAGERQLDHGIAFLRSELGKLSRTYPAEAARLRILGSVEAIDGRLAVATGEPLTAPGSSTPEVAGRQPTR